MDLTKALFTGGLFVRENQNGLPVCAKCERVNRYMYGNVFILTVLRGHVIL